MKYVNNSKKKSMCSVTPVDLELVFRAIVPETFKDFCDTPKP